MSDQHPRVPTNLEQQHKLAKDLLRDARRRRSRRPCSTESRSLGRWRHAPASTRGRAARHRARNRFRLVADARRASAAARHQGVPRCGVSRRSHHSQAAPRIAACQGTCQRADVRVRSACRAHRRETCADARGADRRRCRPQPRKRVGERTVHRPGQRDRRDGTVSPRRAE